MLIAEHSREPSGQHEATSKEWLSRPRDLPEHHAESVHKVLQLFKRPQHLDIVLSDFSSS